MEESDGSNNINNINTTGNESLIRQQHQGNHFNMNQQKALMEGACGTNAQKREQLQSYMDRLGFRSNSYLENKSPIRGVSQNIPRMGREGPSFLESTNISSGNQSILRGFANKSSDKLG